MAIPICPGITYTMVGIDIDAHAQVLDANAAPIPGLFAAGATTGGLEGGKDSAYIGGLIKSGSFGLLAAERIASLEGKQVLLEQPQRNATKVAARANENSESVDPSAAYGLARFPVLRTTIRFGKAIAIGLSLVVALAFYALTSSAFGWVSVPLALGVGAVVLVVVLGVVELIKLVTEFLIPE